VVGKISEKVMPLLMKKTKSEETIRVTLDLSKEFYKRLEALEAMVKPKTKAAVIRQALQLYEYMAKKAIGGHKFRLVDPDGKETNVVFFDLPDAESTD
jgi:hypothetical protein